MPDDRGCVIVTGAGRGIGKAISLALAENGWSVACLSRTETEIMQVAEEIRSKGGDARHFPADIRDRSRVERAVAAVIDAFGRIEVLINNAGSFYALGPVAEVDAEKWWQDISINLLSGPR